MTIMDERHKFPEKKVRDMRNIGHSLAKKGLFEINIDNGSIRWVNDHVLTESGYELKQIQQLTIFDLVPIEFHDKMNNWISDLKHGINQKYMILPENTSDGHVLWWYIFKSDTEFPINWSHGEKIQKTKGRGTAFAFMSLQMRTMDLLNCESHRIDLIDKHIEKEIKRLDATDETLQYQITQITQKLDHVLLASKASAQTALEAKHQVVALEKKLEVGFSDIKDSLAHHTSEILKLIGTDSLHDERIEAFESHVKKTTEIATKIITNQAHKAGRGLSKKVTIPVSVIAAIATVTQYIIQNWGGIMKIIFN